MPTKIKIRRDTKDNWESANPILSDGELVFEKDTKKLKIGDGISNYTNATSLLTYKLLEDAVYENITETAEIVVPEGVKHLMYKVHYHRENKTNAINNWLIVNNINLNGTGVYAENIRGGGIDHRQDFGNLDFLLAARFETDFVGTIDIPLLDNTIWDIQTVGMRHARTYWQGVYQAHCWVSYYNNFLVPQTFKLVFDEAVTKAYIKLFALI